MPEGSGWVGAKFIVDRRCTVKTSLTLTGLIEALKQQSLLRRVADMTAAGALPEYDPQTRLDLVLIPDSGTPVNLTLGEVVEQAAVLNEHRVTCRQCPASLHGYVGGCIAYVPYPLSAGLEYLLWLTAVWGVERRLPSALLPRVLAFVDRARIMEQTPFADGMRARGDLLGRAPLIHRAGWLWKRAQISSAQVLDAFFVNGVLAGDDLRIHTGFLEAALALARAMEPAMSDQEKRLALLEDVEPYSQVHALMVRALAQGVGVYVWP